MVSTLNVLKDDVGCFRLSTSHSLVIDIAHSNDVLPLDETRGRKFKKLATAVTVTGVATSTDVMNIPTTTQQNLEADGDCDDDGDSDSDDDDNDSVADSAEVGDKNEDNKITSEDGEHMDEEAKDENVGNVEDSDEDDNASDDITNSPVVISEPPFLKWLNLYFKVEDERPIITILI